MEMEIGGWQDYRSKAKLSDQTDEAELQLGNTDYTNTHTPHEVGHKT